MGFIIAIGPSWWWHLVDGGLYDLYGQELQLLNDTRVLIIYWHLTEDVGHLCSSPLWLNDSHESQDVPNIPIGWLINRGVETTNYPWIQQVNDDRWYTKPAQTCFYQKDIIVTRLEYKPCYQKIFIQFTRPCTWTIGSDPVLHCWTRKSAWWSARARISWIQPH